MKEKKIEELFKSFLLTKGYSKSNILLKVSLGSPEEITFIADLVIFDHINKEYIGIVEFRDIGDRLTKIKEYSNVIKFARMIGVNSIPVFIISPFSENDFKIYSLSNENQFGEVSKNDFPDFSTLSAQYLTEKKYTQQETSKENINELKRRRERTKLSAYMILFVIVFSIIFIFLGSTNYFYKVGRYGMAQVFANQKIDSLDRKHTEMLNKIISLEKQIALLAQPDSNNSAVVANSDISKLEKKLEIIEGWIVESPEKTLAISQFHHEIEMLKNESTFSKEIMQTKIDSLKNEISYLNTWTFGILLTVVGSILAWAIPQFVVRRK